MSSLNSMSQDKLSERAVKWRKDVASELYSEIGFCCSLGFSLAGPLPGPPAAYFPSLLGMVSDKCYLLMQQMPSLGIGDIVQNRTQE